MGHALCVFNALASNVGSRHSRRIRSSGNFGIYSTSSTTVILSQDSAFTPISMKKEIQHSLAGWCHTSLASTTSTRQICCRSPTTQYQAKSELTTPTDHTRARTHAPARALTVLMPCFTKARLQFTTPPRASVVTLNSETETDTCCSHVDI